MKGCFLWDFWDDKVDNPIDSMFDFDRDGELNSTEKAMEFDFFKRR